MSMHPLVIFQTIHQTDRQTDGNIIIYNIYYINIFQYCCDKKIFFFNVQYQIIFCCRINKMVTDLQISGYRASRTHFDPMGIRTSATLAQLKAVLTEHSEAL